MKPSNHTAQKSKKTLWICLSVVVAMAAILAFGMTSESKPVWKEQAQWRFSEYGQLYALHEFYQKQFPSMQQEAWRNLTDIESELGNQTEHLLFLQDASFLDQSQFETLLNWTAKGNHIVMAVLPHQIDKNQANAQEFDLQDLDAENAFQAAQISEWAGIGLSPKKDWKKQAAPVSHACQSVLKNTQDAYQRIGSNPDFPDKYQQQLLNLCQQNINHIVLPEGKTLAYWSEAEQGYAIKPTKRLKWQGKGANGSHIAHFSHGKGSLTLTTSMSAFAIPTDPRHFSSDLNRLDHAYLATYLAQGKSHVWFVQTSMPQNHTANTPLWQKAWQFSPLLSLLVVCLFGLFIWRHAYRLGSIQIPNTHQQRQLSRFFRAQGEFLWQRKQYQQALSPLQQQLWQQWQRRIPGLGLMDKNAQLEALSRIYPVKPADLMLWLQPIPAQLTAQQWRHYLQAHQNIRNAL